MTICHPLAARTRPWSFKDKWRKLIDAWKAAIERSRQRNSLGQLDDRMLSDIGITRIDAEREIEKPFWR